MAYGTAHVVYNAEGKNASVAKVFKTVTLAQNESNQDGKLRLLNESS